MKVRALVIEHDAGARDAIDEVLTALGHEYDLASSLSEARKLLVTGNYAYILLDFEIPIRIGGQPRQQNSEHFLDESSKLVAGALPPVIMIVRRLPDVDDEDKYRWASEMRSRGVTTFICRPFRPAGRTLDRVVKKLLSGHTDSVRFVTSAPTAARAVATASQEPTASNIVPLGPLPPPASTATGSPEVQKTAAVAAATVPASQPACAAARGEPQWISVTDGAMLLIKDLPWLDMVHARSRISTAANRGDIKTNGKSLRQRRLDLHTFNTWLLKLRNKDLDQEDKGSRETASHK